MMDDVDVAIAAAEAGAAVVRHAYGGALIKHAKSATDFATNADIDAERAILEVITAARPSDALEGEESGRSGGRATSRRWLVDPLCGTLNFAAQTPLVAVNVALLRDSRTLAATVTSWTTSISPPGSHYAELRAVSSQTCEENSWRLAEA